MCKQCSHKEMLKIINQMDDDRKPYTDEVLDKFTTIRHFDHLADDHLYKWHWDEEDRFIESLNANDWLFQFDNELPQSLEPRKIIFIQAGVLHRLIKGSTPISISIKA